MMLNNAQWKEACSAYSKLSKTTQKQYPPLPEVLRARKCDCEFALPKPNSKEWSDNPASHAGDKAGYYSTYQLHALKQCKPTRREEVPAKEYCRMKYGPNDKSVDSCGEHDIVVRRVPWTEAQARVDELIAAIEIWRKARRKIDHEAGLLRADRELTRFGNREGNLLKQILKLKATTMEGLRAKAIAVKVIHSDEEEIELASEGTDVVLAAAVLNELLALAA
jgi:hypothetical protein